MSEHEPSRPPGWIVPTLFVAGLVVYGATLGTRDIWAEECFLARDRPWDVLMSFVAMDRWAGRPPLFYMVRSLFLAVLGAGPWGLRLPALLFGACSVPATWLLARRVLDARAAAVAAVAMLLAALPGYFARESHVYTLSVLLTVGIAWLALDLARGRDPGWRAPVLVLTSLWSSLMLFPLAAVLSVGGTEQRRRTAGGAGARRFAVAQGAAWGIAGVFYGAAFLRLRGRGSGLLSMGGEDGNGGVFRENDILPTLQRAIDGLVFGPEGPLLGTPLEAAVPVITIGAILALCWSRGRGTWSLGGLAVGGFLGGLLPFWLLSVLFGHDHRLDARYFVHLAPLVALAWAGALQALPRRVRGIGELVLLVLLGWGTLRTQSPPNRAMQGLVDSVGTRLHAGDVGVGPEDYFDITICCLTPLPIPRVEQADPSGADRVWVVHDKDSEDRFPLAMRRAMPPGLAQAGFELAYEEFVRPEHYEEFGQVVLLTRYDRDAVRREPQRVTFEVDLGAWPITSSGASIRLFRLAEYPLRYRPLDAEFITELPLKRDGTMWSVTTSLNPEDVHGWEVVVGDVTPIVGEWPPPIDQRPFTVYALDETGPTLVARPPVHWDPALARAALLALLTLLPLLASGAALRVWTSYQSEER